MCLLSQSIARELSETPETPTPVKESTLEAPISLHYALDP